MIKYIQDPVSGKFYPEPKQLISDKDWQKLQNKFDATLPVRKYSTCDKLSFAVFLFTVITMVAQCVRVM